MQCLSADIRPVTPRDPVFPFLALAIYAALVTGMMCVILLAKNGTAQWVPLSLGAVTMFAVLVATRELLYACEGPLAFEEIPPQADDGTPSV